MRLLPSGFAGWWLSFAITACGGVDTNGAGSPIVGSPSLDGSTSAAAPGTERGPCYGNGTCNPGLTCASDLCVKLPGSGGAGGVRGAGGGASGGRPSGNGGASAGGGGPYGNGGGLSSGGRPSSDSGAGGAPSLDASVDATLVECVPGARQCNGPQAELCDAKGTWQNNGAPCQVCSRGACASGSDCLVGERQCEGNVSYYCDTGEIWKLAPCPFACINGTCFGVCVPGTTQCSGNSVQTCHATGLWGANVPCVDQDCLDGVCI